MITTEVTEIHRGMAFGNWERGLEYISGDPSRSGPAYVEKVTLTTVTAGGNIKQPCPKLEK
jgi:hypothetical protein